MHWSPRREHFGDMEHGEYRSMRMPLVPNDFDPRFYLQAHPSLQLEGYLEPNDELSVLGMAEDGLFRVVIPDHRVLVRAGYDDDKRSQDVAIDTIVLHPSEQTFEFRFVFAEEGQTSLAAALGFSGAGDCMADRLRDGGVGRGSC
jgi:hypothetical protein